MMTKSELKTVAIIGSGPAGLFAAEQLADAGLDVTIYDQMPNAARKFLMAGRGGLNITHSDPVARFIEHYSAGHEILSPLIRNFTPDDLRDWCHGLGQDTFIGSSGRVFPVCFKASPLLRAWLRRLDSLHVKFAMRHRLIGLRDDKTLHFSTPECDLNIKADAVLLALGGASWPRLGSDGNWVSLLASRKIAITPLRASNMGVTLPWSDFFRDRYAGAPLKRISIRCGNYQSRSEAIITRTGLEGGAIYALSSALRDAIDQHGHADIVIDLRRDLSMHEIVSKLQRPRGKDSFSNHVRKAVGLDPAAIALLREQDATGQLTLPSAPEELAARIKALPLRITGLAGLERAISSAGGVALSELNQGLMLNALPGVFVAGEMLDWDAPTGGYLLQACFATAKAAAKGMRAYLQA